MGDWSGPWGQPAVESRGSLPSTLHPAHTGRTQNRWLKPREGGRKEGRCKRKKERKNDDDVDDDDAACHSSEVSKAKNG